jgi:nucleotide-binding universal stress UspA family protein
MQQRPKLVVGLGLAPGGPGADQATAWLVPARPYAGFGPGTRAALAAAAQIAQRARGAHVTLLHATGREGEAWPPRIGADTSGPHSALALDIEAALADLRAAGATAECVVTSGAAVPALARRALFSNADVLLVGRNEGADGLAGLGPTAAALVRTAPVPVWVVAAQQSLADLRLVASARDRAGLALAGELARTLRAPLHVGAASNVPLANAPVSGARARREHFDTARRRLYCDALAAFRRASDARIEPEVHVGFDDPQAFVLATAARLRPSLFVLDPATVARAEAWPEYVAHSATSVVVARSAEFVSPYATSALYECN